MHQQDRDLQGPLEAARGQGGVFARAVARSLLCGHLDLGRLISAVGQSEMPGVLCPLLLHLDTAARGEQLTLLLCPQSRREQRTSSPLPLVLDLFMLLGPQGHTVSVLPGRFIPESGQSVGHANTWLLVHGDLLEDYPLMEGAPADKPLSYIKREILKTSL